MIAYLEGSIFSFEEDRLVLLAKNAYVWLDQLAKKYQREITRLDQIPDDERTAILAMVVDHARSVVRDAAETVGFDDSGWDRYPVPTGWGFPRLEGQLVWYRREVRIDPGCTRSSERPLGLTIGKVDSAHEVYVGGRHLGGVGCQAVAGDIYTGEDFSGFAVGVQGGILGNPPMVIQG